MNCQQNQRIGLGSWSGKLAEINSFAIRQLQNMTAKGNDYA